MSFGRLGALTVSGLWWSNTPGNTNRAYTLNSWTAGYVNVGGDWRGNGYALRCTPNYNQLNLWPLQFLRTGYYYRSYGYLYDRTTSGYWWSDAASSATSGRCLHSWTGGVYAQNSGFRGHGFALRCGVTWPADQVLTIGNRYRISQNLVSGSGFANQLANFPLNFLRTGYYHYSDGKVYNRTTGGHRWPATGSSATRAYSLVTGTTHVYPHDSNYRGMGFAVRSAEHNRHRPYCQLEHERYQPLNINAIRQYQRLH